MIASSHVALREPVDELAERSPAIFARFITSELGIKMPEAKSTIVQSRLLRRVRELRIESVDHYGDYFFASLNAAERQHFINAITTNKTDFFREPEHFSSSAMWSCPHSLKIPAALASGSKRGLPDVPPVEEPYTLAMVLAEYGSQDHGFDFAILGPDVSTRVLAHARSGIYPESQILPVPQEYRDARCSKAHTGTDAAMNHGFCYR